MVPKHKQSIDGILLIDKPNGLTSNAVLQKVKRLYQAKKAGHTGSLDPLATGMLPVCFGQATKFSQYLLDADKCYDVTARLGIKTNTGDAEGDIISQCEHVTIPKQQLQAVLERFTGEIQQTPSMFSALKYRGRPLYEYARQGIDIERPSRVVQIHAMTLQTFTCPVFSLTVHCSKGTYIRNLIEDIGDALGVGAYVTALHRQYTMGFSQMPMYTIEDLTAFTSEERMHKLLSMDTAVQQFPCCQLTSDMTNSLRQGKVVALNSSGAISGIVRLYHDDLFIGLGKIEQQFLKSLRLVNV